MTDRKLYFVEAPHDLAEITVGVSKSSRCCCYDTDRFPPALPRYIGEVAVEISLHSNIPSMQTRLLDSLHPSSSSSLISISFRYSGHMTISIPSRNFYRSLRIPLKCQNVGTRAHLRQSTSLRQALLSFRGRAGSTEHASIMTQRANDTQPMHRGVHLPLQKSRTLGALPPAQHHF